jgi:hypothetical protein
MNLKKYIQENKYDIKNTHATQQEYFNNMSYVFNKYELKEEQLNDSQKRVLEDILENTKIIKQTLNPLKSVCDYNLSLVGGTLRDLILGKEDSINDYDIVLSLGHIDILKIQKLEELSNELKIEIRLNQEYEKIKEFRLNGTKERYEIQGGKWSNSEENELLKVLKGNYYLSKIVKSLMNTMPKVKHFEAKNVREEYANYHIMSIHQFEGRSNKKVDLIVSDYADMDFLSTFDVELCKVYVNLNKISTKEDIIKNIIPTKSMLKDVEDKTLSINVIKFTCENLEYFFNKHLLKLKEKFPNYKINIFSTKPNDLFTIEEKKRWVYAQTLKMNFDFPEKGKFIKKVKI